MSSLAATQADGYYVSPDYFNSGQYKKKSRNQYNAEQDEKKNNKTYRGHNQFFSRGVVRFELPFSGTCSGCQHYISKGSRFNATKSHSGKSYYTTPIWEFRMKCRSCQVVEFVIRTNPQERTFDYITGILEKKEKEESLNDSSSIVQRNANGIVVVGGTDEDDKKWKQLERMATTTGKPAAYQQNDASSLQKLIQKQENNSNDFERNASLRNMFRKERHAKRARQNNAQSLGWSKGMELKSHDSLQDIVQSKSILFSNSKQKEKETFFQLQTSGIFDNNKGTSLQKRRKRYRQEANNDDASLSRRKPSSACRPDNIASASESSTTPAMPPMPCLKQKRILQLQPTGQVITRLKEQTTTSRPGAPSDSPNGLSALLEGYDSNTSSDVDS